MHVEKLGFVEMNQITNSCCTEYITSLKEYEGINKPGPSTGHVAFAANVLWEYTSENK